MEPIAISAEKAAELLGVSRMKMYEIMKQPDADFSLKLGGRRLISYTRLKAWVDRKATTYSGQTNGTD